jgi:arylsulfatase A-like enzyme
VRVPAVFNWPGRLAPAVVDQPLHHVDILINVELFRGAIRRGAWKLMNMATLPGRTERYDVVEDPGETRNVAEQHPDVVRDLEARLLSYARERKMSEWLKRQVDSLGFQGKTVLDPHDDIDGPHTEKPALPAR